MAYVVDLMGEKTMVYDSLSAQNDWNETKHYFSSMRRTLLWKCNKVKVLENMRSSESIAEEWRIGIYKDTPQQKNEWDCGIMAIKIIKCLITVKSVADIDHEAYALYQDMYYVEQWRIRNGHQNLDAFMHVFATMGVGFQSNVVILWLCK